MMNTSYAEIYKDEEKHDYFTTKYPSHKYWLSLIASVSVIYPSLVLLTIYLTGNQFTFHKTVAQILVTLMFVLLSVFWGYCSDHLDFEVRNPNMNRNTKTKIVLVFSAIMAIICLSIFVK